MSRGELLRLLLIMALLLAIALLIVFLLGNGHGTPTQRAGQLLTSHPLDSDGTGQLAAGLGSRHDRDDERPLSAEPSAGLTR